MGNSIETANDSKNLIPTISPNERIKLLTNRLIELANGVLGHNTRIICINRRDTEVDVGISLKMIRLQVAQSLVQFEQPDPMCEKFDHAVRKMIADMEYDGEKLIASVAYVLIKIRAVCEIQDVTLDEKINELTSRCVLYKFYEMTSLNDAKLKNTINDIVNIEYDFNQMSVHNNCTFVRDSIVKQYVAQTYKIIVSGKHV